MIQLEEIGVHLPQGYLFQHINLQIKKNDRIGLVGKNGAGKSTLLKVLSKSDLPTEGSLHVPKELSIGYLSQDLSISSELSVFDFLDQSNVQLTSIANRLDQINHELATREDYESDAYLNLLNELNELNLQFGLLEGYQWHEKIMNTLNGLGFKEEDLSKSINTLSGGWKMRVELARIICNKPDFFLLDEPTNHLDILSISWLEGFLNKYDGAVVVISHDRTFLDRITKRTWEISNERIYDFPYNYSKYKEVRQEEKERLEIAKKQQDKEIKHTQELIDKFRAKKNKAAFAQSLITKLEKTERISVDNDQISKMKLAFPLSVQPGKLVMELLHVGKRFGDKQLFSGISISIGRGEKIALLGPNGVGKSTLLKRITKSLEGDGEVNYGHNVNVSYFAQDQAEKLDTNKTVFQTVDDLATGDNRKDLRSILGAFLFSGEEVDKKVAVLSGGERTRLALCQLLLSPSNFLILDEPTNHLDMQSKEVLKQALLNYEGTFIVVSHDREFLDGLTNRIWDIENGSLKIHHFGVTEYLEYKLKEPSQSSSEKQKKVQNVADKKDAKLPQAKELKKKINQLENRISKLETQISEFETAQKSIEEQLSTIDFSNDTNSKNLLNEFEELKHKIERAMQEWETATSELEELST